MEKEKALLEIQQEELIDISSSKKDFEQEKRHRNTAIDFFRVIFCFIIFLFHTVYLKGKEFGICKGGYIGVEFFFQVSGFFMCQSVAFKRRRKLELDSVSRFIFLKFSRIFPYYILAFILSFSLAMIKQFQFFWLVRQTIRLLLYSIWEILFIKMAGFTEEWVNGPSWYLSAMFLVMVVIYPFLKRYFTFFTQTIAPIVVIFSMGYLYANFGSLNLPLYNVYIELLRTCMDICLGAVGFTISEFLKKINFTVFGKVLLTILEVGCYSFIFLFIFIRSGSKLDYILLVALFIALSISFSEKSYFSVLLGQFRFVGWSQFSLAFYLVHENWIRLFSVIMKGKEYYKMFAVSFLCSLASAFILMYIIVICKRYRLTIIEIARRLIVSQKKGAIQ